MRNLLALAALALLIFAGVGYYKGWYTFETLTTPDGHKSIKVDVDTKKIQNDVSGEVKAILPEKK